jgi:hypothetical protein
LLSRGNDYTATNGTTITLIDATITGDIIEVFANELIPLTDAISKGQFTAKGALLSASAAATPAVLAVGTNGQVLKADSSTTTGLAWGSDASGKVLQVVHGTTTTVVSSATNTYIDTGLTASITPSSTSSKILILVSQNGLYKNQLDATNCIAIQLLRGATNIAYLGTEMLYQNVADRHVGDGASINWLDSPSTTSSTTYKTQFKSQNNTGTVYVQSGAGGTTVNSTITLMEIGA